MANRRVRKPVQLSLFEAPPLELGRIVLQFGVAERQPRPANRNRASARRIDTETSSRAWLKAWCAGQTRFPVATHRVLAAIVDACDASATAYLCRQDIGSHAGMCGSSARRHVDRLIAAGLLLTKVWSATEADGGHQLGHVFRIVRSPAETRAAKAEGFEARRCSKSDPASEARLAG